MHIHFKLLEISEHAKLVRTGGKAAIEFPSLSINAAGIHMTLILWYFEGVAINYSES
jgi:hypothetical protein